MIKVVILTGVAMVFAIALLFVSGVMSERQRYRDQVTADVAQSTAKSQTMVGPLLVVPYREREEIGGGNAGPKTWHEVTREKVLLPDSLVVHATVHVETRSRGIYRVPVYRATMQVSGVFVVPPRLGLAETVPLIATDPASFVFGVTDMRGLHRPPQARWNGEALAIEPGSQRPWLGQGFSAATGAMFAPERRRIAFELDLELLGTEQISLVPAGSSTVVEMGSDWPHPGFTGGFLPDDRRVDAKGFRARWELSQYATGARDAIESLRLGQGAALNGLDLVVRFVQPVDVYQQSQRAVKYGMLFVLLTFVAFFLFEVLRRLSVHPIQYGLAGAAVALFFLLLISLSEHAPFAIAYLTASAACVGLLAFYVGHVLRSAARGLGFGTMLAVLYAVLYVLLQSEDYALLLGALLLFGVLSAVMVMTRRVDWYRLGEAPPS